jgi:hypothetical protein
MSDGGYEERNAMKFTWVCLPIALAALLAGTLPGTPAPQDAKAPADPSEMRVRLRLNAAEAAQLLQHYEGLVKRELGLQESVRACTKSGDARLPQYQQALQEVQDDVKTTKERLVRLESEREKLVERLGPKSREEVALELVERTSHTLEKILERLSGIEKRLEKLERQR